MLTRLSGRVAGSCLSKFTGVSSALALCLAAGAAPVATFNYTNVGTVAEGFGTDTRTETVAATGAVGSVVISGTLTSLVESTWGDDARILVTAPDSQTILLTPFLNVTTFVTLTATNFSEAFGVPIASAAGTWTIEFYDNFADGPEGGNDAQWDTVTVVLDSDSGPPAPECATGLATRTFTNMISSGEVGDGGNTIVNVDFAVASDINTFTLSGVLVNSEFNYEANFALTAPSGNIYFIQPITTFASVPRRIVDAVQLFITQPESGTGSWSIESFESFDDDGIDGTWESICFAVNLVPTPLEINFAQTLPFTIPRDGTTPGIFEISVIAGTVPTSTNISVVIDATLIGLGTLTALDNGVAPDASAGDGVYTAGFTIAPSTNINFTDLPVTVSDAQTRTTSGFVFLNVIDAVGACCLSAGCQVLPINDCISQGGSFVGNGVACAGVEPLALVTSAFEDISSTGTQLPIVSAADDMTENTNIGFSFPFFGTSYTNMNVSSNGNIQFPPSNSAAFGNSPIPSIFTPNNALYPLWDDFDFRPAGDVYVQTLGAGSTLRRIVQWNQVPQFGSTSGGVSTFQAVLFANGNFEFRYASIEGEAFPGDFTVGVEDAAGLSAASIPGSDLGTGNVSYRGSSNLIDLGVCSACPACPADFDQDGGVTGGDIAAFFSAFESGETCADTDLDGGITGGDIAAFFQAFQAGGC